MTSRRAVVIGGGIAGLLAARVLSESMDSVLVLEKDSQMGANIPRAGVPQGAHLHVLLKRGQKILTDLFPGIEQRYDEHSCPVIDWSEDTAWENRLGSFPRYRSTVQTRMFSRPFLESQIYDLVSNITNVSFVKTEVTGFEFAGQKVARVFCRDQSYYEGDLIVLAGGAYFPLKQLLPDLPIAEHTDVFPVDITYRSATFATDSLKFRGMKQYYYQFLPPFDALGAVISPIEQGRTVATLIEHNRQESLQANLVEYKTYAQKVPGRVASHILADANPLTKVSVFFKPNMHLRRLDRISKFPTNLIAMGDVVCSLNPVFGQGMTSALLQAELLRQLLKKSSFSSRQFHSDLIAKIRVPFLLSKMGSDTRDSFTKRYLLNYLRQCQQSRAIHRKFLKVLHLEGRVVDLVNIQCFIATILRRSP